MNSTEKIENLLNQVNEIAENEVEFLARNVLDKNRELKSFTMAMGSFFFTVKKECKKFTMERGSDIAHICMGENESILNNMVGYKELNDFINRWDEELKLTGCPMTFTRLSGKKTD